jgi:hypothetical protein
MRILTVRDARKSALLTMRHDKTPRGKLRGVLLWRSNRRLNFGARKSARLLGRAEHLLRFGRSTL